MYKYKQTTDVEVNDLVVWTELPPSVTNRINNKVYKVIRRTMHNNPVVVDETGLEKVYGKDHGFKILQTKPASEAIVGDYMYRISSGSVQFPQHSVIKITKLSDKYLSYDTNLSVRHDEVIVIAQAEPEIKYPLFMQWYNNIGTLVKFDGLQSGTQLTDSEFNDAGDYSFEWTEHTDPRWKPCDFTTEPEIFDIDWWQSRYEAGLPVYVTDTFGTRLCGGIDPKVWKQTDYTTTFSMTNNSPTQKVPMSKEDIELFKQQMPLSTLHLGLCQEISLGATADCSLPLPLLHQKWKDLFEAGVELEAAAIDDYQLNWFAVNDYLDCGMTIGFDSDRMAYRLKQTQPTTKEQPMNKTTLKLLLELLGASEEVKDATNSKFVGIITNEDEYVGYMYFDSKEDATECMAQPKMELHKLHLFEKSCVLAQKPRKVIEV